MRSLASSNRLITKLATDFARIDHLGLTILVSAECNRDAASSPPEKMKVSSSDDNQDKPKTLPSPELNPLTNPVLGRNMGRWAEVYFTSPPEKREQAVQELLHELERESSGGEADAQSKDAASESGQLAPGRFSEEARTSSAITPSPAAPLREEFMQCVSCGRLALAEQKFCGGCGFPLPTRENGYAKEKFGEEEIDGPSADSSIHASANWEEGVKPFAENTTRLFQDREVGRHRRSRTMMTVALAILVATLFYVAARETTAWLRAHDATQVATKAEPSAPGPPQPAQAVNAEEVTQAAVPRNAVPDRALSPKRTGSSPATHNGQMDPAEPRGSVAIPSPQKPTSPADAADEKLKPLTDLGRAGSEELTIAESYLHGTQGKAHDSSQAAQWLWKSVAKQNTAAALLLSDLYIKGDGVPQNCDQARLLLDAAARKGVPGAGERIRNLPKLGCP